MLSLYSFDEFVEDCYTFNNIAGKGEVSSFEDIVNQFKLVKEELLETEEALETNDPEAVLDGVVDIAVTLAGLFQILENRNFDVFGAMKETVENNLSKFPTVEEDNLTNVVDKTLKMYSEKDEQVSVEYNSEYDCYTFKDQNNKVKKPYGFVSNSLKKYLPRDEQEVFKDWSNYVN